MKKPVNLFNGRIPKMNVIVITRTFKSSVRASLKPLVYNVVSTGEGTILDSDAEARYQAALHQDLEAAAVKHHMTVDEIKWYIEDSDRKVLKLV